MSKKNGVARPRTIIEKVWENHIVAERPACCLGIHRSALGARSHIATSVLRLEGGRGSRCVGPTFPWPPQTTTFPRTIGRCRSWIRLLQRRSTQLEKNCRDFGIRLYGPHSEKQGIVHVIGPEQGLTQPGMTVVCGDSHTATHGAFGALAFGIGTSQVEHVLATQCLLQNPSHTYEVRVDGQLRNGVGAKDIILNLISRIGIGGGTGCVLEYCGSTVRSLMMEERMTICNMSIEGGARAGLVAPDDITYEYLNGRPTRRKERIGTRPFHYGGSCRPMTVPGLTRPSRSMPLHWNQ